MKIELDSSCLFQLTYLAEVPLYALKLSEGFLKKSIQISSSLIFS